MRVDVSTRISVVIPTRNAGPRLGLVLDAIAAQEGPFRSEVLAIDSGSTDGTIERLEAHQARILNVSAGTFNHGETRNQALSAARGDYAVLLVQDAVPASRGWLASLVRPLQEDSSIAGTFARQLPAEGASRLTSHYLSNWIAADQQARVVGPLTAEEFARLSPGERHTTCAFDNVCSCIPRSVWAQHPFPSVPIGEDIAWGRTVLLAGYRLRYVPEAAVVHSHNRSARYELSRTRALHEQLYQLFGLQTIPTLPLLARAIASSLPQHVQLRGYGPPSFARAIGWAVAWPLGQYLGARDGIRRAGTLRPAGDR